MFYWYPQDTPQVKKLLAVLVGDHTLNNSKSVFRCVRM